MEQYKIDLTHLVESQCFWLRKCTEMSKPKLKKATHFYSFLIIFPHCYLLLLILKCAKDSILQNVLSVSGFGYRVYPKRNWKLPKNTLPFYSLLFPFDPFWPVICSLFGNRLRQKHVCICISKMYLLQPFRPLEPPDFIDYNHWFRGLYQSTCTF